MVFKYIEVNIVKKIIDIYVKYMILLMYFGVLEYIFLYYGVCKSVIYMYSLIF